MPGAPPTPPPDAATVDAAVDAALCGVHGPIYVGYSGGRDSSVLLHALAARRRDRVVAVHVNHGLHDGAADWQRHCAATARRLGVEYLTRRVTVPRGGSLEAAARAERYRVFTALLAAPDAMLWLAHHRQDQTETVLLRLLQGRGLYGMPARRPLGRGTLLRPLLAVDPARLQDYAAVHGIDWVDDPSNVDQRPDRNFLRHRVLPVLRARWPALDDAVLAAMAAHRLAERRLTGPVGDLAGAGSLELATLEACRREDAVELLRLWLQAHGIPPPRRPALREWLRQAADARPDRQPRLHLDGADLGRHGDRVFLIRPDPRLEDHYALIVPGITRLPHGEIEIAAAADGFEPVGTVEVRFRRGGERLDVAGGHRPLKRLFQEAGVPPWQRASHPLLYDDAGLLAVPGVARRASAGPSSAGTWRAVWRRWG